jgi:hypothetical protein
MDLAADLPRVDLRMATGEPMKVIWDKADIYAGLRTKRDRDTVSLGVLVGYIEGDRSHEPGHESDKLCIISLDDGSVMARKLTHADVAVWLTNTQQLPVAVIGRPQTEFFDNGRSPCRKM